MASKKRGASNSLSLESSSPRTRSQTKKALLATTKASTAAEAISTPHAVETHTLPTSPPPPIVEQSNIPRPHVTELDIHLTSPKPAKKPAKRPAKRPPVKAAPVAQALTAKEIRQEAHHEGLQVSKAVVELMVMHFRHITDRDIETLVLRTAIRSVQKSHKKRILVRHIEPLIELATEVRKYA